jgi:hypothetical protein
MALQFQTRAIQLIASVLRAEITNTPAWLIRPGKQECGSEWNRISLIYRDLTRQVLPDVMRTIERRTVDAVLVQNGRSPRILEVDETQHFNEFRVVTLTHYAGAPVAFDVEAWLAVSKAKRKLEGGGFARPVPPLFPGPNGRHRQRAFRDALCDLLPPLHGFAPTLRISDFETKSWIFGDDAEERMAKLLAGRLPNSDRA